MSDSLEKTPKFPGELSDHLSAPSPDPPEKWSDRVRHAWFVYILLTVAVPVWIGAVVVAILYHDEFRGYAAALVALIPLGIYMRVVQWRMIRGDTPGRDRRGD
jgi:hypothetical protein